jgi:hypothetical protein
MKKTPLKQILKSRIKDKPKCRKAAETGTKAVRQRE